MVHQVFMLMFTNVTFTQNHRALNLQNSHDEGLKIGLKVLEAFNEDLHLKLEDDIIAKEHIKTLKQAREKIKDMNVIDEIKVADDKVTIALFQILNELFYSTYFQNRKPFPLIGK